MEDKLAMKKQFIFALSPSELVVLLSIFGCDNTISVKQLLKKSNLTHNTVRYILKKLEKNELIKSVRTFNKLYAFNLEYTSLMEDRLLDIIQERMFNKKLEKFITA